MTSTEQKNESALTAERLRELLDYDRSSGVLRSKLSGRIVGWLNKKGYRAIQIDGKRYYAHRLAWLHVYGVWPLGDLDHEDTIKHHNWISNLRPASRSQNMGNMLNRRDNTSGLKGASYDRNRRVWQATIRKDGKQIHLGRFPTRELAHAAYVAKALELFGSFANAGS